MAPRNPEIIAVGNRGVNVFAVRGARTVLVDTGFPGMGDTILANLEKAGVRREEISLILITHGHPDHVGSAADLKARLGVPIAIHRAEAPWLRAGRVPAIPPAARPLGRLVLALVKPEFPACEPDLLLEAGQHLDEYGLDAEVLHTPGHSPGSVSLLLPNGDGIAGDVIAGGFARRDRPDYPFVVEDRDTLHRSIARLVAAATGTLSVGHGEPASATSVRRRFARPLAQLAREARA